MNKDTMTSLEDGSSKSERNSTQILPPTQFDFSCPVQWPIWLKRFERYRVACDLDLQSSSKQVNMLIYCLGEDGENLLESFGLKDNEKNDYSIVKAKFDAYFGFKKNIIYERSKFLRRRQLPGEPVNSFVNDLHKLAETCEFKDLKEELIRDLIVIGVQDEKLSESLQMDDSLTLSKAVMRVRQAESVKLQQEVVRETPSQIDFLKKSRHTSDVTRKDHTAISDSGARKCLKCGKFANHKNFDCPANLVECYNCHKRGHYSRCCRTWVKNSNQIKEVGLNNEFTEYSNVDLGEVTILEMERNEPWEVELQVDSCPVIFKLDSGADVSVIGLKHSEYLGLKLNKTGKIFFGPGRRELKMEGFASVPISFKDINIVEDLYVLKDQRMPLLSRHAMIELGLIKLNINTLEPKDSSSELKFSNAQQFSKIFQGLGRLSQEYTIRIKDNAVPNAVAAPRRIPVALQDKVKQQLDKMCSEGAIEPIVEPTKWCSPIVVVPKKDGQVRICVDYTELNKYVLREQFQLPSVNESLAKLEGGKVFTLLDATNGFWQIPLSKECYKLTTFITPFGRYIFKRMPFGICSGPEVFQRRITQILDGLEGVINQADDILIVGKNQFEHDLRLKTVLEKLLEHGLTLNQQKCKFGVTTVKFLGHLIKDGKILADPEKTSAIVSMGEPKNQSELRQFLGAVNYLLKFIPNLAQLTAPLRDLLKKHNEWLWSPVHQQSFENLKRIISSPPALVTFRSNAKTRVAADSSSFGLGATLEQFQGGKWCTVQFSSRSLTPTETRYAQVEKEALALTWACEKFSTYLLGSCFTLLTDHKPLVTLLGNKPISELSARLQRFRMRLLVFDYKIFHVPGKQFYAPDMLSRKPDKSVFTSDNDVIEEEMFVDSIVNALPCSDAKLAKIIEEQSKDLECKIIKEGIEKNTWNKNSVFWKFRGEFSIPNGVLLKGSQIFIPRQMRPEILQRLHEGHLGMTKCIRRARESVWWPQCIQNIKETVANCLECQKKLVNKSEPLKTTELPDKPWMHLSTDLFKCLGNWYLVVQDYYSRFLEIVSVNRLTSEEVVAKLKNIFARHGIPLSIRSDGGTQFTSADFENFAKNFGFKHCISSPHFPQANGSAEKAVDIAKRILTSSDDVNLGLLAYRNAPLESGLSPAELLYGRKLRTTLPSVNNFKQVCRKNVEAFKVRDKLIKQRNERNFNTRKGAKYLSVPKVSDKVWIPDMKRFGEIKKPSVYPRSYVIKTDNGDLRRNRKHFIPINITKSGPNYFQSYEGEGRHCSQPYQTVKHGSDVQREEPPLIGDSTLIQNGEQLSNGEVPNLNQDQVPVPSSGKVGAQKEFLATRSRFGRFYNKPKRYGFQE